MAESAKGHTDTQYLGLLVLELIALIAGLVIHSFIIGVNVTDWWKGRSVTPVDHIVTSLGISRMCAQCAGVPFIFKVALFPNSLGSLSSLILGYNHDFFIHVNIWLTSLLSVVFCLKISNHHTRLFLYLRGMIAHRTVYFIVAAVHFSALNNLIPLVLKNNLKIRICKTTTNYTAAAPMYAVHLGAAFPFLFYYISSVLLFTSLYHHITKMKMSSNLSINLETYYSVMKLVSFTFIYNTMYIICSCVAVIYYFFYCVSLYWLLIVLGFLPALHSSYLIYRTTKLRSQMSKGLQNIINHLFKRKSTEI
ncbi:hypothetical protein GDO78_014677 [Eleutherodactylus coqui]|uniref:Taste receptor type 2 n=1 Tax=Eleutherodactylus coqui TaxID=57060 RepID=A0A8J6EEF8_ELECQ|nr:hypothetical protein GDO78_014677 [Eleutherodactylus coqui]